LRSSRRRTRRSPLIPDPIVEPKEDTRQLREEVIKTCFLMRDKLGYFLDTWGNISVRVREGVLVTPSRMNYEDVTPDDLVVVGWDRGVVRGRRIPTSEMELHRQILLERPDLGVLIHAHPLWATTCACAHVSIPVIVDDMAEIVGGEIRCAPYVPAGHHQELARAVREAIGLDAKAVLMGNHGVLAGGTTLDRAIACIQVVEKTAMMFVQAHALGGARPIPEALWREEHHRYVHKYGKPEDLKGLLT